MTTDKKEFGKKAEQEQTSPKNVSATADVPYGLPNQSQTGTPTFEMETLVVSFANVFTIVVPLTFVS